MLSFIDDYLEQETLSEEEKSIDSIEYRFFKYIYDFISFIFSFNSNIAFEKLLTDRLDDKYFLSSRRKRKDLNLIYDDLVKF